MPAVWFSTRNLPAQMLSWAPTFTLWFPLVQDRSMKTGTVDWKCEAVSVLSPKPPPTALWILSLGIAVVNAPWTQPPGQWSEAGGSFPSP